MEYFGNFRENETVYIPFNTFNSDGASCTITNFINTDVHIHKDNDLTQRNNAAGIVVSVNFDGITGSHLVEIDTSDNTVENFWEIEKDYTVRIEGTTINAQTVNMVIGTFSIENRFDEVDLVKILGNVLSETVDGYLSAGLKKLLDIETPVFTLGSVNQTEDNDTKLTTLTDTRCIEARMSELDSANLPSDVDDILSDTNAIKVKADLLPSGIAKNVALSNFHFLMVDRVDHVTPKLSLTVTARIMKDDGDFADCTNDVSEKSGGVYSIDFTQAEMNADIIVLLFSAPSADTRTLTIITNE